MAGYEEHKEWNTFWSWFLVIALSGALITWAMGLMMNYVEDKPREWEFGNIEFTPAKSVYSTTNPKLDTDEKMIEPLPEGVAMEDEKKAKKEQSDE